MGHNTNLDWPTPTSLNFAIPYTSSQRCIANAFGANILTSKSKLASHDDYNFDDGDDDNDDDDVGDWFVAGEEYSVCWKFLPLHTDL